MDRKANRLSKNDPLLLPVIIASYYIMLRWLLLRNRKWNAFYLLCFWQKTKVTEL